MMVSNQNYRAKLHKILQISVSCDSTARGFLGILKVVFNYFDFHNIFLTLGKSKEKPYICN